MDYRKSQFNSDELQEDTVANNNRKLFAYASVSEVVPNKPVLNEGLPNQKTTFRVMEALDHVDEPKSGVKPVFAYSGTDKGVNQDQWGSC